MKWITYNGVFSFKVLCGPFILVPVIFHFGFFVKPYLFLFFWSHFIIELTWAVSFGMPQSECHQLMVLLELLLVTIFCHTCRLVNRVGPVRFDFCQVWLGLVRTGSGHLPDRVWSSQTFDWPARPTVGPSHGPCRSIRSIFF